MSSNFRLLDPKSIKTNRYQTRIVNIKPRLFFRYSFQISAEVSFQIAVTKTEYLDGIVPVIALNEISATLSDISKVFERDDIFTLLKISAGYFK